jgi:hypothetical protein
LLSKQGPTKPSPQRVRMMMFNENNPDALKRMREFMGPQAIDQTIRQAISMCWMMLPEGNKSIDAVETEIRRLADRALKDLRDDAKSFGIDPGQPPA